MPDGSAVFFCFFFTKLDNNKSNNNNDNNLKSNIFCLCSILLIHINRGFLSHHVLHIQMIGMYRSNHREGAESVSSLCCAQSRDLYIGKSVRSSAHGTVCVGLHTAECISGFSSRPKRVRRAPKRSVQECSGECLSSSRVQNV